jgi:hypothetical protein
MSAVGKARNFIERLIPRHQGGELKQPAENEALAG